MIAVKYIKGWAIVQKPESNRAWSLRPVYNPVIFTRKNLAISELKRMKVNTDYVNIAEIEIIYNSQEIIIKQK